MLKTFWVGNFFSDSAVIVTFNPFNNAVSIFYLDHEMKAKKSHRSQWSSWDPGPRVLPESLLSPPTTQVSHLLGPQTPKNIPESL